MLKQSSLPSVRVQIERIVEHACEDLTLEEIKDVVTALETAARRLSRTFEFRLDDNFDALEAWEEAS